MNPPRIFILLYGAADVLAGIVSWTLLYKFRKQHIEKTPEPEMIFSDPKYFSGLVFVSVLWVVIHWISGQYADVLRRHRLKEIGNTIVTSVVGVLFLFFFLLLDDHIDTYSDYYSSVLVLLGSHLAISLILRLIITSWIVRGVHSGKLAFETLIVGGNGRATALYREITGLPQRQGYRFVGFVRVNGRDSELSASLPDLGHISELSKLIKSLKIEEMLIAIDSSDHKVMEQILNATEDARVRVKVIPDVYDILTGSVKMTGIWGAPLVEIKTELMPHWQIIIKRLFDILLSTVALIVLLPGFLLLAILVRLSGPGPAFFSQERIGKGGKPFRIWKFRTMRLDAEIDGPKLSSSHDDRITPLGKYLRKSRMDELPQFWNVLRGEMSLVGPRPERQHFIDLILPNAPHYRHIKKVRPGITSWGQVKYGYAENVDEMIQRLRFDLLYIENMSLAMDFKILFYTILIVLRGKGK